MSNKTIEKIEMVMYCGEEVQLLSVENTEYGNEALISFESGREDYVPLSTINFIK